MLALRPTYTCRRSVKCSRQPPNFVVEGVCIDIIEKRVSFPTGNKFISTRNLLAQLVC